METCPTCPHSAHRGPCGIIDGPTAATPPCPCRWEPPRPATAQDPRPPIPMARLTVGRLMEVLRQPAVTVGAQVWVVPIPWDGASRIGLELPATEAGLDGDVVIYAPLPPTPSLETPSDRASSATTPGPRSRS